MQVVAFTGFKGSGKDTAAEVLVAHGWQHLKFADCLKEMLRTLLRQAAVDEALIARMIDGDLKEQPHSALGGCTPRWAMQTLGTEWGRQIMAEDFWVSIVKERCQKASFVVISDVRFQNEVDMVRSLGGHVFRINRDTSSGDQHSSETTIPLLTGVVDIRNDFASADAFKRGVEYILRPLLGMEVELGA